MREIRIEYKFLVFMYAYLRQIDLSIDRSRWNSWGSLKSYYETQISPLNVSSQLLKKSGVKYTGIPIVYFFGKPSLFIKIKEFFSRLIMQRQYISEIQVLYCCQLLQQFDSLLNQDFTSYPLEAEKLRNDVACFYTYILAPKMSFKDLNATMRVEHFMENENLKVVAISNFID